MHTMGKRETRDTAVVDQGVGPVCGTAAARGSSGGRSDGDNSALLRCGSGTGRASGGSESAAVQGDQRFGEKDGPSGCGGAGAVSGEGFIAGGANETKTEPGVDASGGDARLAGETAVGVEEQDQQSTGHAGDRVKAGSPVEQDCFGADSDIAGEWHGKGGVADSGGADPFHVGKYCRVGRAVGRSRPETPRIREPDQHQGNWSVECDGTADGDREDQRLCG